MPYADTHTHLDFPDFDHDREEVIARARDAGLEIMINVGTDPQAAAKALEIAVSHEGIYAMAGLHPHSAREATPGLMGRFEELLAHPRMVAIGEIGLDFYRNESPREAQESVLIAFLELQKKTGKPVVFHCRDAYRELEEILDAHAGPALSGVLHCFSSGPEVMRRYLDRGFLISFSGALTYKKNETLREACKICPLERILIETDAPFLAPQSKRGKRNEPSYAIETYGVAATLHGMSSDELGDRVTANTRAVFRL
jgi:TatD DNase family protein